MWRKTLDKTFKSKWPKSCNCKNKFTTLELIHTLIPLASSGMSACWRQYPCKAGFKVDFVDWSVAVGTETDCCHYIIDNKC